MKACLKTVLVTINGHYNISTKLQTPQYEETLKCHKINATNKSLQKNDRELV
jgi:hypothetical protein